MGIAATALAFVAAPLLAAGDAIRDAEKELKGALTKQDLPAVDRAIQAIRQEGGKPAADVLLEYARKMPTTAEQLYWRFVNGASSLRDADGLGEVADEIIKSNALSRDLLYALQNNKSQQVPEHVLGPVLLKGSTDLALMAADQLGGFEQVEAVDVLIAGLDKHEKKAGALKDRIERSLRYVTGADCGDAANWKKWWEVGRKEGVKGKERRGQSTGTVVDHLDGAPLGDFEELQRLEKGQVLVMTTDCPKGGCNFDQIGALLERMSIPYTPVTKEQFEKGEVDLDKAIALLLTCTQVNEHCICPSCVPGGSVNNRLMQCTGCDKHETVRHKLSGDAIKKIKAWVERGGYLFTEDWGIADLVEPAWPKILSQGKMLMSRNARVTPGRGQTSHPLLKGVFLDPEVAEKSREEGGGATVGREPDDVDAPIGSIERFWTIDNESPWIDIRDRAKVTVLMSSDDLVADCGPNGNAVAVTFLPVMAAAEKSVVQGDLERVKGGRVLHVLSHFAKQKSDTDAFALQNMLVNFLVEANRRAPRAKDKSGS